MSSGYSQRQNVEGRRSDVTDAKVRSLASVASLEDGAMEWRYLPNCGVKRGEGDSLRRAGLIAARDAIIKPVSFEHVVNK